MTSAPDKAQKYLEERPFSVCYVEIDDCYSPTDDNVIFEEEYPDIVLTKDDTIILSNKNYIVTRRIYNQSLNKVFLVVQSLENFEKSFRKK